MNLLSAALYVILTAIVTFAVVGMGAAAARVSLTARARVYLPAAEHTAQTALLQTLATQMQTAGSASPAPSFSPLPVSCVDTTCAMQTSATIELTQTDSPQTAATCDPAQTNCAQNVQTNAYVNEGRVTARITAFVTASGGGVLASRSMDVAVRVTQTPPYAMLAGDRGDDGGEAPATPDACESPAAGPQSDTQVRVQYRNAADNSCSDASSFANASYSTSSGSPPGWPP